MAKKEVTYPAILRPLHDDKKTYLITFPDVPAAISEGYDLTDTYLMASDALEVALTGEKNLPLASKPDKIQLPTEDAFVKLITATLETNTNF